MQDTFSKTISGLVGMAHMPSCSTAIETASGCNLVDLLGGLGIEADGDCSILHDCRWVCFFPWLVHLSGFVKPHWSANSWAIPPIEFSPMQRFYWYGRGRGQHQCFEFSLG